MIPSEKEKEKQVFAEPQTKNIEVDLKYLIIPWYAYEDNRLSGLQLKLYAFINTFKGDSFFFSNEHLAKMFNVSEWSITMAMKGLEKYKYISIEYQIKASGGKVRFVKNLKQLDLSSEFSSTQVQNSAVPKFVHINDNKINDNKLNNIYIPVFNYWNSKKIIVHKCLTEQMKRAITRKVNEGYTLEDIKKTIDNYNLILKDDKYFFKYKWPLQDFLYRGFEKFSDLEIAKTNYLKEERRPNERYKNPNTAEKGKYDDIIKR